MSQSEVIADQLSCVDSSHDSQTSRIVHGSQSSQGSGGSQSSRGSQSSKESRINGQLLMHLPSPSLHSSSDTDDYNQVSLRAILTTKEAGGIIGKNGRNVAVIREKTGVKAAITKLLPNVHDRVLTISGSPKAIAQAYAMVAQCLLESSLAHQSAHAVAPPPTGNNVCILLLIPHPQMGAVIGRAGARIKMIQDSTNVVMVASKDMLPLSTERVVELQGQPGEIGLAIAALLECLREDSDKAVGTIFYNPSTLANDQFSKRRSRSQSQNGQLQNSNSTSEKLIPGKSEELEEFLVKSAFVGSIIGKGGAKIQEIREQSGARISIGNSFSDKFGVSERLFSVCGTPQSIKCAVGMIEEQIPESDRAESLDEIPIADNAVQSE